MAMKRIYRRTRITAAESAELWERWKRGEGLRAIGDALGRWHTSIAAHIRQSGGIQPPARRRSLRALTLAEREEISRGLAEGRSVRAIAIA
ncbi:MAG: IS30 family transposase, partial [Burkholderiales bacterium]